MKAAAGVYSLWIAAVLAGCLLALGCGSGESVNNKKPEDPSREAAEGVREQKLDQPVLPEAPWFELPADWAEQHPTLSPNARPEIHWMALAERQIPHDPADSAGRVWLEAVTPASEPASDRRSEHSGETPSLPAASHQRFELVFEVGEPGIVEGGTLFVLPDHIRYVVLVHRHEEQAVDAIHDLGQGLDLGTQTLVDAAHPLGVGRKPA